MMPVVSILMPIYNMETYMGEAIESILSQTFVDFELLLIDDGSSDNSKSIIQSYAKKDARIVAIYNAENKKLVFTRNIALSYISQDVSYIGICDPDDTVSPTRLEKTVQHLETHQDVSVVGINLKYMNKDGVPYPGIHCYPRTSQQKRAICLRRSPLSHGGSLIRVKDREKIGFGYDESFLRAHDYELWSRFVGHGMKLEGLQDTETIIYHRISGKEQGKRKYLKLTLKNTIRIQRRLLYTYKIFPNAIDLIYINIYPLMYILPSGLVFWLFSKMRGIQP